MNKEFNLEEAENFIDNVYQHKFDDMEEILEDGTQVVHLGGLDHIKFTDFESASFTLLRGEQRLKRQVQKQKEVIDKAIEYISNKKAIINTDVIRIFDLFEIDEQGYTNELLDILKGVSK